MTIPLTTSASSTYTITPNTTGALGSSGSPVTFAVGAFKPASPVQSNTFKGYIDTTAGVSTLHVTSLDDGVSHSGFASFTGTLGTSFTASIAPGTGSNGAAIGQGLLSVTLPAGSSPGNSAYIGIGTLVSPAVNSSAFTPTNVIGLVSGAGYPRDLCRQCFADCLLASHVRKRPRCQARQLPCRRPAVIGTLHRHGRHRWRREPHRPRRCSSRAVLERVRVVVTVAGNYYPPISADATMQSIADDDRPRRIHPELTAAAPITNPVKVVVLTTERLRRSGRWRRAITRSPAARTHRARLGRLARSRPFPERRSPMAARLRLAQR